MVKTDSTFEILFKLVSTPSETTHEKPILDFLYKYFLRKGLKVTKHLITKNRYNIYVTKGPEKNKLCLYGHVDTVSADSKWKIDPLSPVVKGDKFYGLGSYDMKGGVTANILTFLRSNPLHFGLVLALTVDEEQNSLGGYAFLKSKYFNNIKCLLCSEPSFKYGNTGIVVGRVGRVIIRINFLSKPKHFYNYDKESDLAQLAAKFILTLPEIQKENNSVITTLFVKSIFTSVHSFSTTSNITLDLDIAYKMGISKSDLLNIIKMKCNSFISSRRTISVKCCFKESLTPYLLPYQTTEKNVYLKYLKRSVKKITNHRPHPYIRNSISDENIFGRQDVSVLGIGPIGGNAHAPNEWVSLKSVQKLHEIQMEFLRLIDTEKTE